MRRFHGWTFPDGPSESIRSIGGIRVGKSLSRKADRLSEKRSTKLRCNHNPSLFTSSHQVSGDREYSWNHLWTPAGRRSISFSTSAERQGANQSSAKRKEIASSRRSESSCNSRQ